MFTKTARKHPLNFTCAGKHKNRLPDLETCCERVTKLLIPVPFFFNSVTLLQASFGLVLN